MMPGVNELKSVLGCMMQDNANGKLSMHEKRESGTLKNITLTGLNTSGITLKGDEAKIKIFKKNCASCICDYIVLTTMQEKTMRYSLN